MPATSLRTVFCLAFSIFFILSTVAVHADSTLLTSGMLAATCLDSNTAQYNNTIDIDGNVTTVGYTKACVQGCSDTLNDCRPNLAEQTYFAIALMIIFIMLMILAIWLSDKVPGFDWFILILITSFCLILAGLTDVFTATFKTIFIVFAFASVLFMIVSMLKVRAARGEE